MGPSLVPCGAPAPQDDHDACVDRSLEEGLDMDVVPTGGPAQVLRQDCVVLGCGL